MAKKRQQIAQQPALLTDPALHYGWKSVQQVARNDLIVVASQEVKILGVRQVGQMEWYLSYIDPESQQRIEAFYQAHESVYARL
jgi:hypothetical protein